MLYYFIFPAVTIAAMRRSRSALSAQRLRQSQSQSRGLLPAWLLAGLVLLLPGISTADTPPLRVVVSVKPLQILLAEVAPPGLEVQLLMDPLLSPHDFQLRPSDRLLLERADLVFWIAPALESNLPRVLARLPESTQVVAVRPDDTLTAPSAAGHHHHGHHGHHHEHGEDPHYWLDPALALAMTQRMVEVLSARQPGSAAGMHAALARLEAELMAVDQHLAQALAPWQEQRFVVLHDAYGHFEQRYGLQRSTALTVSPERPPGARHVLHLQQLLASGDIACVYREPQYQPAVLTRLLAGTQVRVGLLDPLGVSSRPEPGGFADFYRRFGEDFLACLSGAAPAPSPASSQP